MKSTLRFLARSLVRLALVGALCWAGWWLLMDADSPLPPEWHPLEPLDVAAPESWLTGMKLRRAVSSEATCLSALGTGARFEAMPPLRAGACGIDPRVSLRGVGDADLVPVETTCAVALRLAMWERHVLAPAAETHLGSGIARIHHQSSYNCRPIRGSTTRLSTHATGEAIDVRGVTLADGRRLELRESWSGAGAVSDFWQAARDGACTWFVTVLGPDYNALHADHFHMQSRGWGLCR
ncbi:extensin-like domain-containing protein [Jannaschia marina]|uniref:extensin-like domain-containing protein n=1 Tax=Jannaschia marina TaxID=2741674 RepID=UPI0015C8231E|nr:extensin family protein [Jannaschia marina]